MPDVIFNVGPETWTHDFYPSSCNQRAANFYLVRIVVAALIMMTNEQQYQSKLIL